jgi:hypothetical protein
MSNCCLCYPKVCGPKKPKCPSGNCLYIPHLLVGSENSVGPCNETGFIPFVDTGIDTTLCGATPPIYTILSHSNIFTNVSIDSTGINFTTTTSIEEASVGVITYAVSCGANASTATATIILKNLCASVICPAGQFCEKCTGVCEDVPGSLVVSGSVLGATGGLTII